MLLLIKGFLMGTAIKHPVRYQTGLSRHL